MSPATTGATARTTARTTTRAAGRRPARGTGRERARPPLPAVYRRRRAVAAVVALLALLALLGLVVRLVVWDSGMFAVQGVRVTGLAVVAEADVLAAAAVPPGTALAAVDTAGIASRVAALPGVAVAEVGRAWPGTVTVAVTERAPVAVTDTAEGPLPVDAAGVVYRGAVPPGVPRLLFPAAPDDPATGAALAVLAALPEGLRGEVTTVDVTVGGGVPQVELGLTDDRRARFGTAERAAEKASVLVVLLTQEGRVYDVSSPELPTVRS